MCVLVWDADEWVAALRTTSVQLPLQLLEEGAEEGTNNNVGNLKADDSRKHTDLVLANVS